MSCDDVLILSTYVVEQSRVFEKRFKIAVLVSTAYVSRFDIIGSIAIIAVVLEQQRQLESEPRTNNHGNRRIFEVIWPIGLSNRLRVTSVKITVEASIVVYVELMIWDCLGWER